MSNRFKEDNSILKELLNELLNSDYAATEETVNST